MQAVRYHGPGQPLRLEDVPVPEPGPGEIRIRVTAAGLCHTELHFISGLLNLGVAPITLGHEIVGVVDRVGAGVRTPAEGDRVIAYYYSGCGSCRFCRRGEENLCIQPRAVYGFTADGGLAEFVVVPARNAVRLPDVLSDEAAAPIGCSVTTAVHAGKLADVRPGDVVLVYGIGAVGLGLVQWCRHAGATVIAVSRTPAKLDRARQLGATHTIRADHEDVVQRVRDLTDGQGVDVVFELVATRTTMTHAIQSLSRRGRLVFIGYSEDSLHVHPLQLVILEARVMGSVGNTLDELYEAVRLVEHGVIQTVVDRVLPLTEYARAIDALRRGESVGRIVLKP